MDNQNVNQKSRKVNVLDEVFKQVSFTLASEVKSDRITARVEDYKIKEDRHGRKILVLKLYNPSIGGIVSAYSPQYANVLYEALKRLGVEDLNDFLGACFEFEKVQLPKVREDYTNPYPRLIPTRKINCDYLM